MSIDSARASGINMGYAQLADRIAGNTMLANDETRSTLTRLFDLSPGRKYIVSVTGTQNSPPPGFTNGEMQADWLTLFDGVPLGSMQSTLGNSFSPVQSATAQKQIEYLHPSEAPVILRIEGRGIGAAGVPGFLDSVIITEVSNRLPYATEFAGEDYRADPDSGHFIGPNGESWGGSSFLGWLAGGVYDYGAGFSPYGYGGFMSVDGIYGPGLNLGYGSIRGSGSGSLGNFIVDTFDTEPGASYSVTISARANAVFDSYSQDDLATIFQLEVNGVILDEVRTSDPNLDVPLSGSFVAPDRDSVVRIVSLKDGPRPSVFEAPTGAAGIISRVEIAPLN